MKKGKQLLGGLGAFCVGLLFFSQTAQAYIDPSAMTYIVQLVIGVVVAGGAAITFTFKKLKRKLSKKKDSETVVQEKDGKSGQETYEEDEFDDENFDGDELILK